MKAKKLRRLLVGLHQQEGDGALPLDQQEGDGALPLDQREGDGALPLHLPQGMASVPGLGGSVRAKTMRSLLVGLRQPKEDGALPLDLPQGFPSVQGLGGTLYLLAGDRSRMGYGLQAPQEMKAR